MTALRKLTDSAPATDEVSVAAPAPHARANGDSPALVLLRRVEEAVARNFHPIDDVPADGSYRPLHVMIGVCAVSITGWLGALAILQTVLMRS